MSNEMHYRLAKRNPEIRQLSLGLESVSCLQSEMSMIEGVDPHRTPWPMLEMNWALLQTGDYEPHADYWHGWSGVQEILDAWRKDYGIFRAQQVWSSWEAREAWCRAVMDGNLPETAEFPCRTVPAWIEDQVWMSLLPSPGFGIGVYPALVDFGKPLELKGKLLRSQKERVLLGQEPEHPILWDPLFPEVRSALLHQAHLQGAVFQRLKPQAPTA